MIGWNVGKAVGEAAPLQFRIAYEPAITATDVELQKPVNVLLAERTIGLQSGDARALRRGNKALFKSIFNE